MSVIGKDRIRFDRFDSGLELFYRHNLILNFQEVLIASEARRFWLGCSNGGNLCGQQHAKSRAEMLWSKRLRQKRRRAGRQTVRQQFDVLLCGNQQDRSEEHTSELQSRRDLVCRLLL